MQTAVISHVDITLQPDYMVFQGAGSKLYPAMQTCTKNAFDD